MKILHNGTRINDDVPTKLVNGSRYLLRPEEVERNTKSLADWQAGAVARAIKRADSTLQNAYFAAWPVHKQLEAFHDKLNGNSAKLDQMNVDFAAIKNKG